MNEYESIDDMLEYITENTDTILKNVNYNLEDPAGIKEKQDRVSLQELLDEMVAYGLLKIVGNNENGEPLYECNY